jgi:hypothetical protein
VWNAQSKYAQTFLGAFAFRFNHGFGLRKMIAKLIGDVARTKPTAKGVSRDGHAGPLVVSCGTQQSELMVVIEPGGHVGRSLAGLSTCPRGGSSWGLS